MAFRSNVIANYIGQFYLMIIAIVMVPFYLKYLGAEAYGLVGFFALVQSWMLLLDMGLSPTLSREVAKVKGSKIVNQDFKAMFHSLEFIFILISLVVALSMILFSHWIATDWLTIQELNISIVAYCVALIGVMVGLRFIGVLYISGILGTEEQVWINKVNILFASFKFIGAFLLLKFVTTEIQHFFEYQLLIAIVEFLTFSIKFYRLMDIGRFKFYFSLKHVKPILSFSMSIALTGAIWIFITQLDKLILSGVLDLKLFGYLAMLGMVSNSILQLSAPISKAILPRMTVLYTEKREKEMLGIYRKSTQMVTILVFSVTGMVAVYSYALLYAWTGDEEVAKWGETILFWYAISTGLIALTSFQYYLQFVYGKLKMHLVYHFIALFIFAPILAWITYQYGAIGASFSWFLFMLFSFLIWTGLVHHFFVPGLHKKWLIEDILPIFISTIVYLYLLHFLTIDMTINRGLIFLLLILIGTGLIVVNIMVSQIGREAMISLFKRGVKNA